MKKLFDVREARAAHIAGFLYEQQRLYRGRHANYELTADYDVKTMRAFQREMKLEQQ